MILNASAQEMDSFTIFYALDLSVKHNYVTKKNPLGVAIVLAETPNRIATWTDCSN